MVFEHKKICNENTIKVDDENIEKVNDMKYLGFVLNSKLTFNKLCIYQILKAIINNHIIQV